MAIAGTRRTILFFGKLSSKFSSTSTVKVCSSVTLCILNNQQTQNNRGGVTHENLHPIQALVPEEKVNLKRGEQLNTANVAKMHSHIGVNADRIFLFHNLIQVPAGIPYVGVFSPNVSISGERRTFFVNINDRYIPSHVPVICTNVHNDALILGHRDLADPFARFGFNGFRQRNHIIVGGLFHKVISYWVEAERFLCAKVRL